MPTRSPFCVSSRRFFFSPFPLVVSFFLCVPFQAVADQLLFFSFLPSVQRRTSVGGAPHCAFVPFASWWDEWAS